MDIERMNTAVGVICEEIQSFDETAKQSFHALCLALRKLKIVLPLEDRIFIPEYHGGEFCRITVSVSINAEIPTLGFYIMSRGGFKYERRQKNRRGDDSFYLLNNTQRVSNAEEFTSALSQVIIEAIKLRNDYAQGLDLVAETLVSLMDRVKSVNLTI